MADFVQQAQCLLPGFSGRVMFTDRLVDLGEPGEAFGLGMAVVDGAEQFDGAVIAGNGLPVLTEVVRSLGNPTRVGLSGPVIVLFERAECLPARK